MHRRLVSVALAVGACSLVTGLAAQGAGRNWAASEIKFVTQAGVLGNSPATFAPQTPLTEAALAAAIKAADAIQHVPAPAAPKPSRLTLTSSIAANATIGGVVLWSADAPGRPVDHVDFAIDGTGIGTTAGGAATESLDTRTLTDGPHQLAINVSLAGGGYAIGTWSVTVANAPGSLLSPPSGAVAVPVAKSALPAATAPAAPKRVLYSAASPARPVSLKGLDAALVGYLDLEPAARKIQSVLERAGLHPPANTGTEAVARMLGLRLNHPAGDDDLELLPFQPATRAEAAWSFAQVLHTNDWAIQAVQQAADTFTLPGLTPWQQRLLRTAVSYVGYPYIWGGTSPTAETLFGVHSAGGFDCSGFVWRVVKLTSYPGEGKLASVLRGRTTYQMSGEVSRAQLVPAPKLQPADVMFFGARGPSSKPSEVDHTGLYLGNGWFIQSSGEGVTLLPFDGWYGKAFAWARRPLREAGLG